ncbi:hypothetical protein P9139_17540 [Curtobacterium flaccumfaciens]|nr:hypothetical protein P9139_17540 [Curtobacterium flaccumfaciens]
MLATGIVVVVPAIGLYGLAVVSSWFWNSARFPVTAEGITRYQAYGPVPFVVVVVVAALVAVGLTVSVGLAVSVARASTSGRTPVGSRTDDEGRA